MVQAALAKRRDTPVLFISSHSHSTLLSKGVDGNRWPVLRYVFKRLTRRRGLDVIHENMRLCQPLSAPILWRSQWGRHR